MSTEAVGGATGLTVRSVWKLVWWIDPDGGSNATVRMLAAIKPIKDKKTTTTPAGHKHLVYVLCLP